MVDVPFWQFESTFETSSFSEWTSEVDTESKLDVLWYKHIVERYGRYPGALPYRGSYAAHIDLSIGTADAYVQETVAFDTALAGTIWVRFYFQVTSNLVMAASDYFTIFALQSGAGTDEAVIGLLNSAGDIRVVAAETSALAAGLGAATRSSPLSRDRWHLLELGCVVDSGGNDGTIEFWVDGYKQGASIATLTQAAITQARLGAIGIDAGTTAGHLFYDQVVAHTLQIGGFRTRYPQVVQLTKSGFIAQGTGKIKEYALVPGGAADNHLIVYDADRHPILAGYDPLGPELANVAAFDAKVIWDRDVYFNKGLYVQLSGTSPRATVTLHQGNVGEAQIRQYAVMRQP